MCCRYYNDRFILSNKLFKYLLYESSESSTDKHAALQSKRVERTRKYSDVDTRF